MKKWIGVTMLCLLIAGCSNPSKNTTSDHTGNPEIEEYLSVNTNADIFTYNGVIYKNASEIKWVTELDLHKGELVKEINSVYTGEGDFPDKGATKLPVGTKIYKHTGEGAILIAEVDGEGIPYLGLIEG